MRKNDDGYVLPFVLVVMIVLTIISTSLMTAALRNLQSQQKFTERMVDKYAAEGEIEKVVAQLSNEENFAKIFYDAQSTPSGTENQEVPWPTESDVKEVMEKTINNLQIEDFVALVETTIAGEGGEKKVICKLNAKSSKESPIITTTIEMSGKLTKKDCDVEALEEKPTFSISDIQVTYKSYEISTGGGT